MANETRDKTTSVAEVIDSVTSGLVGILGSLTTENLGEVQRAIGVLQMLGAMYKDGK